MLQFDNRHGRAMLAEFSRAIVDVAQRERLFRASAAAWAVIDPLAALFRTQCVHADLAHYNLVANGGVVASGLGTTSDAFLQPTLSGVIDFGDVVRSWVVSDLATAIASLLV